MPVHGEGVKRTPPSLVHEPPTLSSCTPPVATAHIFYPQNLPLQMRHRHTRTKGETMVEPSATLSASPTSPEGGVDAAKSR